MGRRFWWSGREEEVGSQNPGQGAEGLGLRGQGQVIPRQGIEEAQDPETRV